MARPTRLRVLVDADVRFAGAASPSEYGAGLLLARLAEITLIEAVAPQQAGCARRPVAGLGWGL